MYESIIDRLEKESRRVIRKPLDSSRVKKIVDTVKQVTMINQSTLDNSGSRNSNIREQVPTEAPAFSPANGARIPIVRPQSASRFPTEKVDFNDDITWL